ncbi:MAG: methylmalonyl Co-A mutase-associated GTPase MeaB [Nocardioidaceae bacterium]|nr:methylmalonyl Co-A mutase-associated GTPase MeaB [Nocardioidaceae bacterium]
MAERQAVDVDALVEGVRAGSRAYVARAITLVESSRSDHQELAQRLLVRLLPDEAHAQSVRVGVSGAPGVGKSTFIDAFGMTLVERGHRVAVLAVDPSSSRGGGSILGDKTRMERLATSPDAFVRPSPSAGVLGGVARATRETIVVMEAAGYDVVLVETVGVGQSEVAVAGMVDTFLLLTMARTGDQLQGIKKGILELVDVLAVNKADGDHVPAARMAARELSGALRMMQPRDPGWTVPVLTCSAVTGEGLQGVWQRIVDHREHLSRLGLLAGRRSDQQVDWAWTMFRERALDRLARDPRVRALRPSLEADVRAGRLTATLAAQQLLDAAWPGSP